MTHTALIFPFVQDNWIWITLLLLAIGYYAFFEFQAFRYRHYRLSPPEVVELINRDNAQILDLRPKNFFEPAHIAGALNIECEYLLKHQPKIELQKDKPVILFSGYESDGRKALPILKTQGFEKIFILTGGAQEWKKLNYPFVSSKVEKKNASKKAQKKGSSNT